MVLDELRYGDLRGPYKRARAKFVSGIVLLPVGAHLTVVGAYLISAPYVYRDEYEREDLPETTVLTAGAVVGSIGIAALVTGAILLPTGLRQKREIRRQAEAKYVDVNVAPWASERAAGLTLSGKF